MNEYIDEPASPHKLVTICYDNCSDKINAIQSRTVTLRVLPSTRWSWDSDI